MSARATGHTTVCPICNRTVRMVLRRDGNSVVALHGFRQRGATNTSPAFGNGCRGSRARAGETRDQILARWAAFDADIDARRNASPEHQAWARDQVARRGIAAWTDPAVVRIFDAWLVANEPQGGWYDQATARQQFLAATAGA